MGGNGGGYGKSGVDMVSDMMRISDKYATFSWFWGGYGNFSNF